MNEKRWGKVHSRYPAANAVHMDEPLVPGTALCGRALAFVSYRIDGLPGKGEPYLCWACVKRWSPTKGHFLRTVADERKKVPRSKNINCLCSVCGDRHNDGTDVVR